jgi:hypothetical protein
MSATRVAADSLAQPQDSIKPYAWDIMRTRAGRVIAFFVMFFLAQAVCQARDSVSVSLAKWHAGQRIEVNLINGEKLVGHLGAIESDRFVLEPDKHSGAQRTLRFDEVRTVSKKMTATKKWVIAGAIYAPFAIMGLILGN